MYFSSPIGPEILLPWEAPVQWYLKCMIRIMLFICVLKYDLWASSALYSVNALKWKTIFFVCKHILILMTLYNNSLFGIVCMCAGDIYIYVRMCPYTRVCYPHTCVHTYMNFARVYVSCFHMLALFVRVRACVCLHLTWNVCYFIVGK